MKIIAIGALGTMLGPSASHLNNNNQKGLVKRILLRSTTGGARPQHLKDWKNHGANPVNTIAELSNQGDWDTALICAGKNGDDAQLIRQLLADLNDDKPRHIIHFSTVSTRFTLLAAEFCHHFGVSYVNYPLTGGDKGAKTGKMLILCSGPEVIYQQYQPILKTIGLPQYFGEAIDASCKIKLTGHIMVFNGFSGISTAALLDITGRSQDREKTVELLDVLNTGSGGTQQWPLSLRQGLADDIWQQGFAIKHALPDLLYTYEYLSKSGLGRSSLIPIVNMALTLLYVLLHADGWKLCHHAITKTLLDKTHAKACDGWIDQHLDTHNLDNSIDFILTQLPSSMVQSICLDIQESHFTEKMTC